MVAEATGWEVRFAEDLIETEVPSDVELSTLRELERQTILAHSNEAADRTPFIRTDPTEEVARP